MVDSFTEKLDQAPLTIDGAHGEGGGQILRSALSLSAITGRAVNFINIRAGRPKPGLAAQHLTSVRAAAALCSAHVSGDSLGSLSLQFTPRTPVRSGQYTFDVSQARLGGSAGSATLVLQTMLVPLSLAGGLSTVIVCGGTHLPASPSFHYLRDIWLPSIGVMGIGARLRLIDSGWFPIGQGKILGEVAGRSRVQPIVWHDRGEIHHVWGHAITANLPLHISQRMAAHATAQLAVAGLPAEVSVEAGTAASPGAALFLGIEYRNGRGGVTTLGKRGKPAEAVAEEAVAALLDFHRSGAAIDAHLADQLILPAAVASGPSTLAIERITRHLTTNSWVVQQFGIARVEVTEQADRSTLMTVTPQAR